MVLRLLRVFLPGAVFMSSNPDVFATQLSALKVGATAVRLVRIELDCMLSAAN
jgi:hypothetical protein